MSKEANLVEKSEMKTAKAEEQDLKNLSKHSHVPVEEIKATPEAPERTAQDEFNDKLRELSKKVLELVHGAGSDKAEQIIKVVKDTVNHAHSLRYETVGVEFDPLPPPSTDGGFRTH